MGLLDHCSTWRRSREWAGRTVSRHQGTPKSMHASGTSGPVASRDDGAIFLTASKTYQESLRLGVLLTLEGFSSERRTSSYPNTGFGGTGQTERVCVCRKRFPETDSKKGLTFWNISNFRNFLDTQEKGFTRTKNHPKQTESECRAQT